MTLKCIGHIENIMPYKQHYISTSHGLTTIGNAFPIHQLTPNEIACECARLIAFGAVRIDGRKLTMREIIMCIIMIPSMACVGVCV